MPIPPEGPPAQHATLIRLKDPGVAAPWFTALVYLNPMDNLGPRFWAPGGPSGRGHFSP
ncbi:hypothetical protein ACWDYJ_23715 [Streptomyces sp. NPDC003042]